MEPYEKLELEVAEWCGRPNTVVCSTGTAALHLALEVMKLPRRSSVLVPNYCFVAVPRAVVLADMEPVLVGCTDSLLIDPVKAVRAKMATEGKVTFDDMVNNHSLFANGKCRGIVAVHTYGRRCDMDALVNLKTKYGMVLIEDMAEAHGLRPHPETDAACWSFYKNKVVHGEEGGAVAFLTKGHAELARSLRSIGATPKRNYTHVPRGHNYRLSNLCAEPILLSLSQVNANLLSRRTVEDLYDEHCPIAWQMPVRDIPWVYDIRINGLTRERQDRVVDALKDHGVAARHGFKYMSSLPEFEHAPRYEFEAVPDSEVVCLPITPEMVVEDCVRALDAVKASL